MEVILLTSKYDDDGMRGEKVGDVELELSYKAQQAAAVLMRLSQRDPFQAQSAS